MGMDLYDEFTDHAPEALTFRELHVGGVLAKNASDRTRLTFDSVVSEKILRRARVTKREMYKVLATLQKHGVVGKAAAGFTNQTAKYQFLQFAPERVSDSDTYSGEGVPDGHPQPEDEGVRTGSDWVSELGQEGVRTGSDWVSGLDTPTPSSPDFSHLPPPREPPALAELLIWEGGRDTAPSNDEKPERRSAEFLALASIVGKHPKLAMGEMEITSLESLVAPWLERTTVKHLETALTLTLPPEVGSPVGLVRSRLLGKLPPPRVVTDDNTALCQHCSRKELVALVWRDRPYCATCTKPCTNCQTLTPDFHIDIDTGRCASCRI